MTDPSAKAGSTRRTFLKQTSIALSSTGLLSSALATPARARARGDEPLRLALVGCGGRGTGACIQALRTEGPMTLVAMADAFADRLEGSLKSIGQEVGEERLDVPESRRFTGFDAYQRAIDEDVDVVILATPPHFRPDQFEAARGTFAGWFLTSVHRRAIDALRRQRRRERAQQPARAFGSTP